MADIKENTEFISKRGRESSVNKEIDRAKLVRDRQNEERQRKLEELRQQALAAQRFREHREEERRKRIEELKSRDFDRRNQVEERKRVIWEAEQERREAILRKNQEREARIEAKRKNERSHIVFAFGSSTPRMLEPADTGGASFWGTRRASSITNVMMSSSSAAQALTRRSSERDFDGSKKRASSASGLERKPDKDMRMSSSMYEVFNWNETIDPSSISAKCIRGSLALLSTTDATIDDLSQREHSGEDNKLLIGTGAPMNTIITRYANRRRTDLMPTIPSSRDNKNVNHLMSSRSSSAKSFIRSPGRTYSMSRLDQLAQPRRRTVPSTPESQQPQQQSLAASSMSRSMSYLASGVLHVHAVTKTHLNLLKHTDNSRSMSILPCSTTHTSIIPRPTRAERLRRKAREHQAYSQFHQQHTIGNRSGEVTPNSPSRPHSSMSLQSTMSTVTNSTVNLRPRFGTLRRPRPASIADTGISTTTISTINDLKQKDSKPPLPKVHSTPKKQSNVTSLQNFNDSIKKNETPTTAKSIQPGTRVMPKTTPLQSPMEQPSSVKDKQSSEGLEKIKLLTDEKIKIIPENITVLTQREITKMECDFPTNEVAIVAESKAMDPSEVDMNIHSVQIQAACAHLIQTQINDEIRIEEKSFESKIKPPNVDFEEQSDLTASMIQKIRITTEEEAKAALAERRRLAREQAEREAELERQRVQEEARLEAERLRFEEEEQRRFEEETLRLVEEARKAEEQRLKQAIEETKKREEEEKKRREDEMRIKQEKEETERKSREEAEKQRVEMVERLKREEEERNARRKRVEAIMSRTRAKNQLDTSKDEENEGEKLKEDSPNDENKSAFDKKAVQFQDLMATNLISEVTHQIINNERTHHIESNNDDINNGIVHKGMPTNGVNNSLIKPIINNEDNNQDFNRHNNVNHGNCIDEQTITLDNTTL